ncbi:unnamed protein product [Effrenium voratum]|nr:unnamed protein product [Effrenium voratum]
MALMKHLRHGVSFTRCVTTASAAPKPGFVFSPENFRRPDLPKGLQVRDLVPEVASDASLAGLGRLVHSPEDFTVKGKTFEIVRWPQPGWRPLDPGTGDEAGTTEGDFEVQWQGDFFYGHNLAIASENNQYLDGLGKVPEEAALEKEADAGAALSIEAPSVASQELVHQSPGRLDRHRTLHELLISALAFAGPPRGASFMRFTLRRENGADSSTLICAFASGLYFTTTAAGILSSHRA